MKEDKSRQEIDLDFRKRLSVEQHIAVFEKSLSYSVALAIAILIAIEYTNPQMSYKEIIQQYFFDFNGNSEIIAWYIFSIASLLTIPYFYLYTLKNSPSWSEADHTGEIRGLIKFFCLYEIGVLTVLYLLTGQEKEDTASKLLILIAAFLIWFCYILVGMNRLKRRKDDFAELWYFILVSICGLVILGALIYQNFKVFYAFRNVVDFSKHFRSTIYTLMFGVNSLINIIILCMAKVDKTVGICSNRIKIIHFVISVAVFPIVTTYCFLSFMSYTNWAIMEFFLYFYEIVVVVMRFKEKWVNAVVVTFFSVLCIIILPFIFLNQPVEGTGYSLRIDWYILIAITVYMAAIKYWGYIFRFMKQKSYTAKAIKDKIYEMLVRFEVSFTGAIVAIVFLMIWADRFLWFTIIILIASYIIVGYTVYLMYSSGGIILKLSQKNIGVLIEIVCIMCPTIGFLIDLEGQKGLSDVIKDSVAGDFWMNILIFIAVVAFFLILYLMNNDRLGNGKSKNDKVVSLQDGFELLVEFIKSIFRPYRDANAALFHRLIWISELAFFVLGGLCYLIINDYMKQSLLLQLGTVALVLLMILKGVFLNAKLAEYYMENKEGMERL